MPFEFKFDILSSITNQIIKQYVAVSADFEHSYFLLQNFFHPHSQPNESFLSYNVVMEQSKAPTTCSSTETGSNRTYSSRNPSIPSET